MTRPLLQNPIATLCEQAEKPSKYRNRKVTVDGITFHSAKEARRYGELKLLNKAGEILGLRLQPRFPLRVNGALVCTYVADFEYHDLRTDKIVVEDVKGVRTDTYKLKAKLFAALHGFPVREV
jgi:hypothetical protein